MGTPIQYTSRTFTTCLNDINSDPTLRDKPEWFKRILAGVMDVMSMNLNAVANQSFLSTCFTEAACDRLLELIDYQRTPQTTASGTCLFHAKRGVLYPFTVLKKDLCGFSQGNLSVASKRFGAIADATFTAFSETFTRSGNNLVVARVYTTGELVRLTTTGTLPAPLSDTLDYFAINVSPTTIKIAITQADAYVGTFVSLTDAGTGTHTIGLHSKAVTVYQQNDVDSKVIGKSDGATEWQEFILPDKNILINSISGNIIVNGFAYIRVDTFVYSTPTDKHFKIIYNTDGTCKIRFGNGVMGIIPPAFDVYAAYSYGGGSTSNITSVNQVTAYGGSDSNVIGITNPGTITGGADKQTIASAKALAPVLLKTRDRFVTVDDGTALVLAYSGVGIARAKVNKNVYGVLSSQIVCVPNGGGYLSAPQKTALAQYLIDKSILESIDVRVVDPVYIPVAVTSTVKILSGYTWTTVKTMYELAVHLIFSELTQEIKNTLENDGITAAVAYINSAWSYSFTSSDYTAIQTMIERVKAPNFGTSIQASDVYAILDEVDGVDYEIVSAPSFPVTFATNEISSIGAITTTQIP